MQENLGKTLATLDAKFLVETSLAKVCVDEEDLLSETSIKSGEIYRNKAFAYSWDKTADADD